MRSIWFTLIGLAVLAAACGGTGPEVAEPEPTPTVTATAPESPPPTPTPTPTDTATETPPAAQPTDHEDLCAEFEPESQVTDQSVLFVSEPVPGSDFPSGSTVTGCTNAFEATFQWELLDADGQVLASDFETASCGSGCLGTFEFTVDYEGGAGGTGTLRVFTESAEDGSVQDEHEVPVQLGG